MTKKKRYRYLRWFQTITILLLCMTVFLVIKVLINHEASTFEIYLDTEKLKFTSSRGMDSEWSLDSVRIKEDFGEQNYYFTGSLVLPPHAEVSVIRQSFGYSSITIEGVNPEHPLILKDTNFDPIKRIDQPLTIYQENIPERMNDGKTIIWPLNGIIGEISTGRPISDEIEETVPLLRNGRVDIYKHGLFNSGIYRAGTFELNIGDEISIKEPEQAAFGFIAINEQPNMMVAYRLKGGGATLKKPGGAERQLQVSLFDQLINDRFLAILSITTGGFLAVFALLTFIIDFSIFHKSFK